MNKFFTTAAAVALLSLATPAMSVTEFSFSQGGWSDGGLFTGSFFGEDLNNDGQLTSFDGEVTNFSATYTGPSVEFISFSSLDAQPFGGDFPISENTLAATGLVFTLDGTGQLGDDTFGNIEGLGVFSNNFYLAVGPGPFNQCNGVEVCGGLFAAEDIIQPFFETQSVFAVEQEQNVPFEQEPDVPFELEDGPVSFLPQELAIVTNINAITVTGDDLGDPEGLFESSPVLPDEIDENGGFVFNLEDIRNLPGRIFFIDPEIATGYTYTVTGDSFFSVQAPSLGAVNDGDGQYLLTYGVGLTEILLAGDIFEFGPSGVSSFTITGIDPALMLDPTNDNAFVTGVSLVDGMIGGQIVQTPITQDVNPVPLPAAGFLLLGGLAGLSLLRRRGAARA